MVLALWTPMHTHRLSLTDAQHIVRAEYLEIPGLHLTQQQVQRLWDLDAETAMAVLRSLVDARFLRETRDNAYVRAVLDEQAAHRPAFGRSRRHRARATSVAA